MNLATISFNTGEVTPKIDSRSDVEKYASSCRILENMIPTIYGGVDRRPGTKYIATAKNTSESIRLIPFIYSSSIAYMCEFGDLYIRFYYGGAQLLDGADDPVNVTTTYLKEDLPQLQIEQIGDVMWITHPDYAPSKLTRTTATSFSLDTITFDKGPFLIRNDFENDDDVTMAVTGYDIATATAATDLLTIESATDISDLFPANRRFYISGSAGNDGAYTVNKDTATTYVGTTVTIKTNEDLPDGTDGSGDIIVRGGTGTLTASTDTFTTGSSGHAGTLFKLTHKRVLTDTSGKKTTTDTGVIGQAVDIKGRFSFNTHGTWDATVEIQRMEDETNWETFRKFIGTKDRNIQYSGSEADDNVQYRINVTTHDVGSTINADMTVNTSTQDSIVRISSVTSTTEAVIVFVSPTPLVDVTKRWYEGAWSAVQGYPTAVGAIEGRIIYGGTSSKAQTLWLSEVDDYENFEEGLSDADSFSIVLTSTNSIRWLRALESLIIGTSGDEWIVQSSKIDAPLTPTDFSAKQQSQYGSKDIQAVKANEVILFVDFVGRRVREFVYSDDYGKYFAPDLNALAEHITFGGILGIAYQRNPDPILWSYRTDGTLLSMTYERDQNVVAWARHPLGGDGLVKSVAVIPSTSEDEIWLAVERSIDNDTVVYIEQMQPRDWGDDDNMFFVDSGLTDTGGSTSITVAHLEHEEVSVLKDSAVMANETVRDSTITIEEAGDTVHVGLPYRYKLKPMRMDVSGPRGTTKGSVKRIHKLIISFLDSRDVQYGDTVDHLKNIDWRTTEVFGSAPDLYTGDKAVTFDGGFNPEDSILISGIKPSPCTVRAIVAQLEVTES